MKTHLEAPRLKEQTHRWSRFCESRRVTQTKSDGNNWWRIAFEKRVDDYLPILHNKPSRRKARTTLCRGNETILLVEPDVAMREVIRQVLQQAGYHVLPARDGKEAHKAAARHHGIIHLLMTDIELPEMSGRQLATALTVCYRDMKVLYVAGDTAFTVIRYGFQGLAINWLQRPFPMHVMIRKVREVLDQRIGFS